jgi:cytoskeleton protein RodZ
MTEQGQLLPLDPGDALRKQRLEQGLSLFHVADQLRIRENVLLAIEENQTQNITPVYLKGYIRAYAKYLDVDLQDETVVRDFENTEDPQLQSVFTARPPPRSSDRWLKATSYVVASILIAALAWQFTHEAVRFSQGESDVRVSEQSLPDATPDQSNSQPAGFEGRNSHINASIASIDILSKSRQSAGEKAWAAIASPSQPATQPLAGMQQLEIASSADTWVEILDATDRHLEMDLVRGGTKREYFGLPPFRILIGRASSVELSLNGEPFDLAPYTRGNVARLSLEAEQVADASSSEIPDQE